MADRHDPWRMLLIKRGIRLAISEGPEVDPRFDELLEDLGGEWLLLERTAVGEARRSVGRRIDARPDRAILECAPDPPW